MGDEPAIVKEMAPFRRELARHLGDVREIIVFGSRVHGKPHEDSDVDVLVVSESFAGLTYVRRAALTRKAWKLPYPVDFLCYTPDEFDRLRRQTSIVSVAVNEGVALA